MAWKKIGSLRKNDKGKFYIKVDEDVALGKGQTLSVQDPRKKLQESVQAGRLTEEKAQEIAAKIPEFIRYELFLVTPQD